MTRKPASILALIVTFWAVGGCLPGGQKPKDDGSLKVEKGDLKVEVVETGALSAIRTVEVKSRASGRVKALYVDEGAEVVAGQLIAEIDPRETQLQVDQNSAQVAGAEAGARAQSVQIAQRRVTAKNALEKAQSALRQIQMELKAQPTLTNASISSAQSAFDQARQSLSQLDTVTHPNARTATEIALQDAQNSLSNAQSESSRLERLLQQGYVAKRDTEAADLQVKLAQTKVRTARENLDRLAASQKLEREQAVERVTQARAQLEQSRANSIQDSVKREQYLRAIREVSDARAALRDVDALIAQRQQQLAQVSQLRSVLSDGQRQLGETRIVAPSAGVVTDRPVQVGELVSSLNSFSAGTTIFKIEDRSQMVVKLNINEIDVAKLSTGMTAEVKIEAFPNETFQGKVTKIAPSNLATAATSTDAVVKYEVEVTMDNVDRRMKSGMSAKCTMRVIDQKEVVRIPLSYLGRDEKGAFVMLKPADPKNKKDKGTRVDVKTGAQSAAMVEITSGLTPGQVIVKPEFTGPKRKGMMSFGDGD